MGFVQATREAAGYHAAVVQTRGGCHALIDTSLVPAPRQRTFYVAMMAIDGVDQAGDLLLPVPGCVQGDASPTLIHKG
jgi:hypothetical protein